jgi:hypothetical protein
MSGAQPIDDSTFTLYGWGEIRVYLALVLGRQSVSEKTAHRYEHRRDALPIVRALGRVTADRRAIKAWAERQKTLDPRTLAEVLR